MREIKFRGKTVDNEWHYGFPQVYSDGSFDFYEPIKEHINSIYTSERFREVYKECKKETLGQYTGLKDKNGKEIYEGDIVNLIYEGTVIIRNMLVVYGHYRIYIDKENGIDCWSNGFALTYKDFENNREYKDFEPDDILEVVSNIYDNPELVEKVVEE